MRSTSVVDAELCEEKTMPITFVESRGLLNFTVSYSVHRCHPRWMAAAPAVGLVD